MALVEKNHSNLLHGTPRPDDGEDPSILEYASKNRLAPGEGGVQTLRELWDVLKESAESNRAIVRARGKVVSAP